MAIGQSMTLGDETGGADYISVVPDLEIRDLDEAIYAKLRLRANRKGRSTEEEALQILRAAVDEPPKDERIWEWLRRRAIERQRGMPPAGDSTDLIREERDA